MRRIIFAVLFFAVVLFAMFWFYRSFDKTDPRLADALRAVPPSAALIFETEDAADIWRDLSQTNLIWDELRATDYYFRLDQAAHAIDSAMRHQDALRSYMARKPIAISVHSSGARSYSYLLSLQLAGEASPAEVKEALTGLFKPRDDIKTKTYDGVELHTIIPGYFDQEVHFFVHEGLLVMSFSILVAEESIRVLRQESSVISNPSFVQVRKTKGSDARGQFYVNYKQLHPILAQYASKESRQHRFFTQTYADWSALDVSLKANAIVMNGFVQSRDSSDAWLGAFRNLKAPSMKVLDYMPSNTAYFAFFGYGDFLKFRAQQKRVAEIAKQSFAFETTKKEYDAKCNCKSESLALDWIGSQAAAFITEPAGEDYVQNQYAVFATRDASKAWKSLTELNTAFTAENQKGESEIYREFEIQKLNVGNIYGDLLGEAYAGITDPYAVKYGDVIIMANSLNGLRTLINAVIAERTLARDKGFAALGNQISGESNLLIYSALARSPYIYQNILDEPHAKNLAKQTDLLRTFQAFVYQVSHYKNDLYYNNVYLRHNPDYKQETNSLWEIALPNPVSKRPYLLTNHYTKALEVFMQDDSNHVYLIGNTGKVIWDVALDGPIVGGVQQVDVYRNSKLQILLSTPKSIYLLDRNGNNVESYPVRLPAKATNAVSVVDYDRSRDYRFFIALEGGGIRAYDIQGKQIKGWDFEGHPSNIVSEVSHLRVKSKDYIFALSDAGEILLLDRQGKPRHQVKQRAVGLADGGYHVESGTNTIEEGGLFYVDTLGAVVKIGFNGRVDRYDFNSERPVDYDFKDINGDGKRECIILSEKSLVAYELNGKKIFDVNVADQSFDQVQYFKFPDGKICFGLSSKETGQVMLYQSNGKPYKGFPLYGGIPIAIGDMNRDGYFNLITASGEGYVYAYAIE